MSLPNTSSKHVALLIEVPIIYTDDLDNLREFEAEFVTESDWLLNCISQEQTVVRLRTEISGEKDSAVVEVWGLIREAQLVDPTPSGRDGVITDELLAEHGVRLMRDERACEWCMTEPAACGDGDG